MKKTSLLLSLILTAALLHAQEDVRKAWQTQMIMAEKGDTIRLPEGTFSLKGTLSLDEKENIVILGAGMGKTVLSFKGQTDGAEGLRISNCRNIQLIGFTAEDAKGDCIKVMATEGIRFYDVKVAWTGKPKASNGAYGFYPVQCTNVLIDHCEAIGASDAGIYVGQSHNIVVRNSRAAYNVAGIEIENSTLADVHDCEAYMNTGGILVFDLPDLPKKKGGNVRVYNNKVIENNYRNFAPKGNTVATVPPGTGIMVLAANHVEVYNNEISRNITAQTAVVSYHVTRNEIKDKGYYPYPTSVYIHDNRYTRDKGKPTLKNLMGVLLFQKFGRDVPEILFDGIIDPKTLGADGQMLPEYKLCIRNNGSARYANLDLENNAKNIQTDISVCDCDHQALEAPTLSSN